MQTVYSKAADEYPIKNGQLISCMRIDKRNNIYLAVGGDLNIYSLRRLGATKDYLECIIHIADLYGACYVASRKEMNLLMSLLKASSCRAVRNPSPL